MWNPEFWSLESGKQLKESGIQVPLTKNLESKTVLDFLTQYNAWGDYNVYRDKLYFIRFLMLCVT